MLLHFTKLTCEIYELKQNLTDCRKQMQVRGEVKKIENDFYVAFHPLIAEYFVDET